MAGGNPVIQHLKGVWRCRGLHMKHESCCRLLTCYVPDLMSRIPPLEIETQYHEPEGLRIWSHVSSRDENKSHLLLLPAPRERRSSKPYALKPYINSILASQRPKALIPKPQTLFEPRPGSEVSSNKASKLHPFYDTLSGATNVRVRRRPCRLLEQRQTARV